jgi:hypothetical protein
MSLGVPDELEHGLMFIHLLVVFLGFVRDDEDRSHEKTRHQTRDG